jgi:hypothetical protein
MRPITAECVQRRALRPVVAVTKLQSRLKALPGDIGRDTWDLVRSLIAGHNVPDLELEFLIGSIMVSVANLFEADLAIESPRSPFLFPAHVVSTSYGMYDGPLAPALAKVEDRAAERDLMVYPEGPLFEFSERRRLSELLDVVGPGRPAGIAHIFAASPGCCKPAVGEATRLARPRRPPPDNTKKESAAPWPPARA